MIRDGIFCLVYLQQSHDNGYFDLYVCMYARTHVEVPAYTIELLVFTSAVKYKQYVNYAM
jgi:hypothetical protein